jgi:hypothetical protein
MRSGQSERDDSRRTDGCFGVDGFYRGGGVYLPGWDTRNPKNDPNGPSRKPVFDTIAPFTDLIPHLEFRWKGQETFCSRPIPGSRN